MNGFIQRFAASMMQPVRQRIVRGGRVALLLLVAFALLAIALAYAAAALSSWLTALYGPIIAALALAGIFLLLALAALGLALRQRSAGQDADGADLRKALAASLDGAPSGGDAKASDLASLVAGVAAANRLKPFELVALAVLAGFLVGRRNGEQ